METFLDRIRDENLVVLFWIGSHAGIGWTLFESEDDIRSFLNAQVSEESLGETSNWGDVFPHLLELRETLEGAEAFEGNELISFARSFIEKFEVLTKNSSIGASSKFLRYEEILVEFSEEYKERLLEDNLPWRPMEDNLEYVEEMIISRYGDLALWWD